MDCKSLDITSGKISKLKEFLPETFIKEKVDWKKLKAALGEDVNFENERYNFNRAGKSNAYRELQLPLNCRHECMSRILNFIKNNLYEQHKII